MITETRTCPTCGTAFTWTSRQPRQRFCTPRCKAAWWRHHDTPNDVRDVTATGNDVRNVAHHAADLGAGHTCPHCRQPITVITLLLPPAAAHVAHPGDTP